MPAALGAEFLSVAATGRPLPRCIPPRRAAPAAGCAAGGLSRRAALRCGRSYAAGGLSLRAAFRCGRSVARPPSRPPALSAARAYARPRYRPPALSPARPAARRRCRRSVSRALRGFRQAFAACRVRYARPSWRRGCAGTVVFVAKLAARGPSLPALFARYVATISLRSLGGGRSPPPVPPRLVRYLGCVASGALLGLRKCRAKAGAPFLAALAGGRPRFSRSLFATAQCACPKSP